MGRNLLSLFLNHAHRKRKAIVSWGKTFLALVISESEGFANNQILRTDVYLTCTNEMTFWDHVINNSFKKGMNPRLISFLKLLYFCRANICIPVWVFVSFLGCVNEFRFKQMIFRKKWISTFWPLTPSSNWRFKYSSYEYLPRPGFEPGTSYVAEWCLTNCATAVVFYCSMLYTNFIIR